jgi:hypothetical protein
VIRNILNISIVYNMKIWELKMIENLAWKIRISVLWLFLAGGYSAYTILDTARPGVKEGMALGGVYEGMVVTEELLLFFTLFWLISLTMAFLALILKDSVNRWANIILCIFWAFIWVIDMIEGGLLLAQYLINFSMIVVVVLIIWHAWKLPKQEPFKSKK